jgi:hydroxylamine reductase (hybrid-cluster protein)
MENATEKQVLALKKFARNHELSRGILRGIQFENLNKKEASDLIDRCIKQNSNFKNADELDDPKIKYAQNFRDNNGKFRTTALSEQELEKIREAHRQHCQQILSECSEDYPEESELILAVFDKRCDKIYTWIQQALDEKVRQQRREQV